MSPISTQTDSFNRSILLAGLKNLSIPHFLAPAISTAASATKDRLLIVLISSIFGADDGISHTGTWNEVQQLLSFVYVQGTKVAQDMGKMLMEVDVLLKGLKEGVSEDLSHKSDVIFRIEGGALCIISLK